MLKKSKHTFFSAKILKYVWPFFNTMHERVDLENLEETVDLI